MWLTAGNCQKEEFLSQDWKVKGRGDGRDTRACLSWAPLLHSSSTTSSRGDPKALDASDSLLNALTTRHCCLWIWRREHSDDSRGPESLIHCSFRETAPISGAAQCPTSLNQHHTGDKGSTCLPLPLTSPASSHTALGPSGPANGP